MIFSTTQTQSIALSQAIARIPVIDQHCHAFNDQKPSNEPLANRFTESDDPESCRTEHALGYRQGCATLRELLADYEHEDIDELRDIAIQGYGYPAYVNHLFEKAQIYAILVDMGLSLGSSVFKDPQKTVVPGYLVLRIETMAEEILSEMSLDEPDPFGAFRILLDYRLSPLNPLNAGFAAFKSIAAYRCGFDTLSFEFDDSLEASFLKDYADYISTKKKRLESPAIISVALLVALQYDRIIQFHTGFGDSDLNLEQANPLHLKRLFMGQSSTNFVLLHASYPFMREAGYLASLFQNVYVDFGLSVPLLSPQGQHSMLKQLMELSPLHKILYSSDGHGLPEMHAIAAVQGRKLAANVLGECVNEGVLTSEEALEYAHRILFKNAYDLYSFGLHKLPDVQIPALKMEIVQEMTQKMAITTQPKTKHVRIAWADSANIVRCRIVSCARFNEPNFKVPLTNSIQSFPFLYDVPYDTPVGEVYLKPDSSSFVQSLPWAPDSSLCFGYMEKHNQAWTHCPRTFLRLQEAALIKEHGLKVTVGFEIEFVLLKDDAPVDTTLYCEMKSLDASDAGWTTLKLIIEALETLGIPIWQYHSESAHGQFEISIGPFSQGLVLAADALVLARETIYAVSATRGYQATLVPKPFPDQAGSASHVHLGLQTTRSNANLFSQDTAKATQFVGGILKALPALCMISLPTVNSYARLQPQCWAGAYQCFGYENREAPIRLICKEAVMKSVERFEVKAMDGTANPYLTLGCLIAAGASGVSLGMELGEPVQQDPSTLPVDKRPRRLPLTLEEAIEAFGECALWEDVFDRTHRELLIKIRQAEWTHCQGKSPETVLALLKTRY